MTHPHTNTPPAARGGTQAGRSQTHTPPLMPGSHPRIPSQHYSHHNTLSMPPALPKTPSIMPTSPSPAPRLLTTGQQAHPLLRVHTPVNHRLLNQLLQNHPNHEYRTFIAQGFLWGFSIGYQGPRLPRMAPNLPSATSRPDVISAYLGKECASGNTAGPFPEPPLRDLIISPLGAVPKKRTGKWRLIMHLSYPEGSSINDGINVEDFPLKYMTVYDAMDSIMRLGQGALLAKLDIKSAFRLCPVHPADQHLLGMHWNGQYYFDRVLPFGLRSAPFIFNSLAEAVEWISKEGGVQVVHHYLDDFLILGKPNSQECQTGLQRLTGLCTHLGIPLAEDKLEGPSTVLTFLGIELDSTALQARLPEDKLTDLKTDLDRWLGRRSCTKQEILSLIGSLSFAAKVIPAGRTFIRRLIDASTLATHLNQTIHLREEARKDIKWWAVMIGPWNGTSFLLHPNWTPAPDLALYTDSSGAIGYGAYCNGSWFNGKWTPDQLKEDIQWKELYPIVMASIVWGEQWYRKKVLFVCDNQAVVACIRSGTSHSPAIMALLRNLFLVAAKANFTVSARHLAGVKNRIADCLSRFHMQEFRRLAPAASTMPTRLPTSLPLEDI